MANRYFVMGQVFIANGTTTVTEVGRQVAAGNTTINVTGGAGNFTIYRAQGVAATVTSGTAAVTGSPVTLAAGANTITVDGNGTCTLNLTIGTAANWNTVEAWSAASGGTGGASVPTSADNVFFDALSFTGASQVLTVDASANCLDMDWTGATNTPTFAGSEALAIKASLTFIAAMVQTYTGTITFTANVTGETVTVGGTLACPFSFYGTGGGWTLQDTFNIGTQRLNLSRGTLSTNNQTITCGELRANGTATRTLDLGSSIVNCTSLTIDVITGLTLDEGTSSIRVTGTGAFAGGGETYYEVQLNGTAHTVSGANTFANLVVANSAVITFTHTTTYTMADVSIGTSVQLVSSSPGTGYTLAVTGASVTGVGAGLSMVDATVTMAGAPANKLYWVQDTGNWSDDNNHWSKLSGGLPAGATNWTPSSTTSVYFDAKSFSAASQVVTVDAAAYCLDMIWTGATNNPRLAGASNLDIYGNFTTIAAMSWTKTSTFYFRGTCSVTTNGLSFATSVLGIATGNVTFQDAFTVGDFVVLSGTINTNNQTITCGAFDSNSAIARTITLGASTINCTAWNIPDITNLTFTANTATIKVTGTGVFAGGALTYYEVQLNGTAHTISGSNTFTNLILLSSQTQTITLTDGTTQTVTTPTLDGSSGHVHTLKGSATAGWTISKASGIVSVSYCTISYSTAIGGAVWEALTSNSNTDSGNNYGWIFGKYMGAELLLLLLR